MISKALVAVAALLSAGTASAATLIFNSPNFNGPAQQSGAGTIATWNISLGSGQAITAASFTSAFGSEDGDGSTALGYITIGGITVGTCASFASQCYQGPNTPITYNFAPPQFAALLGTVTLDYVQTSPTSFGLSPGTLTLTVADGVPEPQSWMMLIAGFGLVGAGMRRRAATAAA